MTDRPPHFVQAAGRPLFAGHGKGELSCRCGQSVLVSGYDPAAFLAVDIRCAQCGAVTTTPGLSALDRPPAAVVRLERTGETPPDGATIPPNAVLAGREELDRLMALYLPRHPDSDSMTVTAALLDSVGGVYDRLTGGQLAAGDAAIAAAGGPEAGVLTHPLVWALRTLRVGLADPDWDCVSSPAGSVATALVGAFRYFNACWSHHPVFPMMAAAAADDGFSLHALALFAAARSLSDSGNRIAFHAPTDGSGRVRDFTIATGPAAHMACMVEAFGRFEWPHVQPWDLPMLLASVRERMLASKARINLKRPGIMILSPGAIMAAMEQPLVDAINEALRSHGRRYPALAAISVIVAKFQPTAVRNTVRFGYSFYPIANPRHTGDTSMRIGPWPGT